MRTRHISASNERHFVNSPLTGYVSLPGGHCDIFEKLGGAYQTLQTSLDGFSL